MVKYNLAFNMAELIHTNICGLATSADNNLEHDIANKNESTDHDVNCEMRFVVNENSRGGTPKPLEEEKKNHFQFLSSEKSISSIDSLVIIDHLSLNVSERNALSVAFENIDSFNDGRSCAQNHLNGNQRIQKYNRDRISQFPLGGNTEQNTLNHIKDESGEVGMKMSNSGGCFGEVPSKPTGKFKWVQTFVEMLSMP